MSRRMRDVFEWLRKPRAAANPVTLPSPGIGADAKDRTDSRRADCSLQSAKRGRGGSLP